MLAVLLVLMVPLGAVQAGAHALQPAYLELQALGGDAWRAVWRKPAVQGAPMAIEARLPAQCSPRKAPTPQFDGVAWTATWVAQCPDGLTGGTIAIEGLSVTRTDVLVRYEIEAGRGETQRLTPDAPDLVIPADPGVFGVFASYSVLGIVHILEGVDHLLFVFALLLLIPDRWRLIWAITAFTAAHSLTLALATLGLLIVPGPPVEAVIALSIMFLASEYQQRRDGQPRLSQQYPWLVSFAFGLLHGLGFAGALSEIGLPETDVPLALFAFNLGVEAGQLLFVAAVLTVGLLLARLAPAASAAVRRPGSAGTTAFGYAIGGVSAFWFVARVAEF